MTTIKEFGEDRIGQIIKWALEIGWLADIAELKRIRRRFPALCLGAFNGEDLLGVIMGYLHEKSAWICNFIVDPEHRKKGIGSKLFEKEMEIIKSERRAIKLFAEIGAAKIYQNFGFEIKYSVSRHETQNSKINFRAAAKRARNGEISLDLAGRAFGEDRSAFLKEDMIYEDSVILANGNSAIHSRSINDKIFIGPFLSESVEQAEILLRGAIMTTNKKICVDSPDPNRPAARVLRENLFVKKSETLLMNYGENINENIDMIYGFATAASHG